MKYRIFVILFFISFSFFSQGTSATKLITTISKADTVHFIADNSGCFHSYILEVKFCKQKTGDRKVIIKGEKGIEQHHLSAKNYQAFIKNYQASVDHFSNVDKVTCTSITAFDLSSKASKAKINSVTFKNTDCLAEFNPEMFLQNLFRANETHKK
jgi:hypothetical protein